MARSSSDGLIAVAVVIALVVMALKYIAIAAGIGLALFGLFHLFKWLYIGWVNESKADPLFTQVAKEIAKKKSFNEKDFQQRYSLSDDRIHFIESQLNYAGVLSGNGVLVENQWELRSFFRSINTAEDFFINAIDEQVSRIQDAIDKQIKRESNELTISLLTTLSKNIRGEMMIDYLSLKQKASSTFASQEEIEALSEQINEYSKSLESLSIIENNETMAAFESFCSMLDSLKSVKIWSSKHNELSIQKCPFNHVQINEIALSVPYIDNKEWGYYLYPSFVIVASQKDRVVRSLRICNYSDIEVNTRSFTESKSAWFKSDDAEKAYTTWLHTCKDGSPDLRYSYNPSTTYYHFYAANLSRLNIEIVSGSKSAIDYIEKAFFIARKNNVLTRQVTIPGSDFVYLGEHEWKDVNPTGIKLEDSTIFPAWPQMEINSRTAINLANTAIQDAYSAIRDAFLNGKLYDLSDTDKANYGFVLFFDLISAYSFGNSDIQKLCKELDVLTISCGKTEKHIKESLEKCFKYSSKPQEDKDFAAAYFNLQLS